MDRILQGKAAHRAAARQAAGAVPHRAEAGLDQGVQSTWLRPGASLQMRSHDMYCLTPRRLQIDRTLHLIGIAFSLRIKALGKTLTGNARPPSGMA